MDTSDDDVARLRAERDELAAQVTKLEGRRWRRVRLVAAGVITVLACLMLTVAPHAIWAKNLVFDTDRLVDVVGPLATEPAVQTALAERITNELVTLVQPAQRIRDALPDRADVLAVPLAGALTNFVRDHVETYLATDDFAQLWDRLVRRAHELALRVLEGDAPNIQTEDGKVTLDLIPVIERVLNRVIERVPALFGREIDVPPIDLDRPPSERAQQLAERFGVEVPPDFGQVVVYDEGRLAAAQDALDLSRRLIVLIVVLALLLPVVALLLSPSRRRTGIAIAGGTIIGLVVMRRGLILLSDQVLDALSGRPAQGAVDRLMDRLLDPLFTGTAWMLAIGLAAVIVLYLVGPARGAQRVRSAAGSAWGAVSGAVVTGSSRVEPDRVVGWVVEHVTAVRVGAVVAALFVLWTVDFGWLGTLLVLALLAAAELTVGAVARGAEEPTP